jgi:thymidylate synthase
LEFINKNIKLKLDSRKLFWSFWKIDDQNPETKSPCLTGLYFRQNLDQNLDMHPQLRANNAVRISPINVLIFIEFFQKVAQNLNLKVGNYYHHSNSYHIYQKDWELAKLIAQK